MTPPKSAKHENYQKIFKWALSLFLLFLCTATGLFSAENKEKAEKPKTSGFIALPIIYYTPETRWALGAGSMYYFRPRGEGLEHRPSSLGITGFYTQNKQYEISISPDLYLRGEKHRIYSNVKLQKSVYNFYGIGSNNPAGRSEVYTTHTVSYFLRAQKKIWSNLNIAVQHEYRYNNIIQTEKDGLLEPQKIPGSEVYHISGFSLHANWDSRNNVYYPYQGSWCEASVFIFRKIIGSNYDFSRYNINLRKYISVLPRHILAVQGLLNFINGTAPFQILSTLGGQDFMRGYYQGRFRENHSILLQMEYRMPVWKRFGAVGFASAGKVVHKLSDFTFKNLKYAYGFGIRFAIDPKERLNIRLDFGFTKDSSGVYFTVMEAF